MCTLTFCGTKLSQFSRFKRPSVNIYFEQVLRKDAALCPCSVIVFVLDRK